MKRWMIYFLVFAGLHVFYFYTVKISIQALQGQVKSTYQAPPLDSTFPNWSNPKKGDIFIVMDSNSIVNYYKISEGIRRDSISLLLGKYAFQSQDGENISDEKWNNKHVNAHGIYTDSLQRYAIDDFFALRKDVDLIRGFKAPPPLRSENEVVFYNMILGPYMIIIHSLVAFFTIWLFVFLSTYLAAISSFSKQQILIVLTILLFILLFEFLSQINNTIGGRILVYLRLFLLILILFPGIQYLKNKFLPKISFFDQEAVKFIFILILGFTLSCLGAMIGSNFEYYLNIDMGITNIYNYKSGNWKFHIPPFTVGLFLTIATGNFLNNFRTHFFKLRKEANSLALAQKKELEFESEIETLQARINPHFLYNSLNSIASLAQDDPAKTEQMAIALSKFYKQTTNRNDQHLITVEEEISLLQTYLDIEKIRFGERLVVGFHCDENAKTEMIPRFLLQPLIENAIKYGYNASDNKTFVKIVVEKTSDKLIFKIIDHGPDFPEDLSSGYGLRSVQKKLKLFYPDKHQLAFVNQPEKQVYIEIKIKHSQKFKS